MPLAALVGRPAVGVEEEEALLQGPLEGEGEVAAEVVACSSRVGSRPWEQTTRYRL